jgi:hypothetical protein
VSAWGSEEEKDTNTVTEQKTERRAQMFSDKTLAQLVLLAAFVSVIYFLLDNSILQQLLQLQQKIIR